MSKGLLTLSELQDYSKWIGRTAADVYQSVSKVGGWQFVFPGKLPRWASRLRQFFNVSPTRLRVLDQAESNYYLSRAQTALPESRRAKTFQKKEQRRGMGMSFYDPNSSTRPGTMLKKPDPKAPIHGLVNNYATGAALSGDVYEDLHTRRIWFQTAPGGAVYHFGRKISNPTAAAIQATIDGQELAPVFKLLSPDGTGGSREVCISNPFIYPRIQTVDYSQLIAAVARIPIPKKTPSVSQGRVSLGNVGDIVDVSKRYVTDSVAQGSYNYAETMEKGLPAHERLDVNTDPMQEHYYIEPDDLFEFKMVELQDRRFLPRDPQGNLLVEQDKPAP